MALTNILKRQAGAGILAGGRPLRDAAKESFEGLRSGASERLGELRETADDRLEVATQPQISNLALQKGSAIRGVQGEGSRQNVRRSDIEMTEGLGKQEIEMQGLLDLNRQEGGLQQIETQFTSVLNEMVQNGFQQELAGLREAMNEYMAKEGAALDAAQLASQAKDASLEMYGRFAQSAAMEFGRK